MTIKEVEKLLEIPRATVRFYEKEGLIDPSREENGYRDYSKEDVEKLRKIIILRKIGMSVEDVSDVFDGAKSMSEALEGNVIKLQKQMEELKGAIKLSQKMKEDAVEISTMNATDYWSTMEEEEKQGNSFMDIAKDIVDVEKDVVKGYFGKTQDSSARFFRNVVINVLLSGVVVCALRRSWELKNFKDGMLGVGCIMVLEILLSVPLYFLGKKHEWIRKHRTAILIMMAFVLVGILLGVDHFLSLDK